MNETRAAIDLTADCLGRWIVVHDYKRHIVRGRLDVIELHADPRHRVLLRIATQEPIIEEDGGGIYWSTFGNERAIDRDEPCIVGERA